jgi:hypothetical protein
MKKRKRSNVNRQQIIFANLATLTLAISSNEFPSINPKRTSQLIRRLRKGHAALAGTLAFEASAWK